MNRHPENFIFRDKTILEWHEKYGSLLNKSYGIGKSEDEIFSHFYNEATKLRKIVTEYVKNYVADDMSPYVELWSNFFLIKISSFLAQLQSSRQERLKEAEEEFNLCLSLYKNQGNIIRKYPELKILVNIIETCDFARDLLFIFDINDYCYLVDLTAFGTFLHFNGNDKKAHEILKKGEDQFNGFWKIVYGNVLFSPPLLKGGDSVPWVESSLVKKLTYLNPDDAAFKLDKSHYALESVEKFIVILLHQAFYYIRNNEFERGMLYLMNYISIRKRRFIPDTLPNLVLLIRKLGKIYENHPQSTKMALLYITALLFDLLPKAPMDKNYRRAYAYLAESWLLFGTQLLKNSVAKMNEKKEVCAPFPKLGKILLDETEKKTLSLGLDEEMIKRNITNYFIEPIVEAMRKFGEVEAPCRLAKNYREARQLFLPSQKWFKIAIEYNTVQNEPSTFIQLYNNYANLFESIEAFEEDPTKLIKLHKKRISVLEELLSAQLKSYEKFPEAYFEALTKISSLHELIYSQMKKRCCKKSTDEFVNNTDAQNGNDTEGKIAGEHIYSSKDEEKLVKILLESVSKLKILLNYLKISDLNKSDYEEDLKKDDEIKVLLTIGKIVLIEQNILISHPQHSLAKTTGLEAKNYSNYFMKYVENRVELMQNEEINGIYEKILSNHEKISNQTTEEELQA